MEDERGCGFRQWHGVYFVTGSITAKCDRGLLEIEPCSCCGERPRFNRGLAKIKPFKLFGNHGKEVLNFETDEVTIEGCEDPKHCWLCFPPDNSFLDWVGKSNYTIESFTKEAHEQGISRRYTSDALPVGFRIGESVIYLAMEKIIEKDIAETIAEPKKRARKIKTDAVFMAYRPTRVEKLFHITEFTQTHNKKAHVSMFEVVRILPSYVDEPISYKAKNLEEIEFCGTCDAIEDILRKGITPVFIDPDNVKYHKKSKASRKKKFEIELPKTETESDLEVSTVEEAVEKASKDEDIQREIEESKPEPEKKPFDKFFERKDNSLKENESSNNSLKESLKESNKMDNFEEEFSKQQYEAQQESILKEEQEKQKQRKTELMNEAILESGETSISEQVQMEEMQKEYDSTHKEVKEVDEEVLKVDSSEETPEEKFPEALDFLNKKYATEIKKVVEEVDSNPILGVHHVCKDHCEIFSKCEETNDHESKENCNICKEEAEKAKKEQIKETPSTNLDDAYEAMYGWKDNESGK